MDSYFRIRGYTEVGHFESDDNTNKIGQFVEIWSNPIHSFCQTSRAYLKLYLLG